MKIAIVGTCPSSCALALNLPEDWKLWVCSPGNQTYPRVDAWFEIHEDLDFPTENGIWQPYIDWLNSQPFKLYAQRRDLMPRAELFPAEALVDKFGPFFFRSQPAWMLAFAIYSGAKEIGLFGLDMAAKSEYGHQKPDIFHYILIARSLGIKVLTPPESEVLTPPPLYGYSLNAPMARKLLVRRREIEGQLADMDKQIEELRMRRQHFRGVLDDVDWTQQTWTGGVYREQGEVHRVVSPTKKEA